MKELHLQRLDFFATFEYLHLHLHLPQSLHWMMIHLFPSHFHILTREFFFFLSSFINSFLSIIYNDHLSPTFDSNDLINGMNNSTRGHQPTNQLATLANHSFGVLVCYFNLHQLVTWIVFNGNNNCTLNYTLDTIWSFLPFTRYFYTHTCNATA